MGDNIEQFELEDVGFTTNEKVAGKGPETQEKSGCGNWKWYLLALGALLLLAIIGLVIGVSLKSGDNSSAAGGTQNPLLVSLTTEPTKPTTLGGNNSSAGGLKDLLEVPFTTEPPKTTEENTETRSTISGMYLTFAFSFGKNN